MSGNINTLSSISTPTNNFAGRGQSIRGGAQPQPQQQQEQPSASTDSSARTQPTMQQGSQSWTGNTAEGKGRQHQGNIGNVPGEALQNVQQHWEKNMVKDSAMQTNGNIDGDSLAKLWGIP